MSRHLVCDSQWAIFRHWTRSPVTSIPYWSTRCLPNKTLFSRAMSTTKPTDAAAPASTWLGHKGAAGFDLRSDTMTTPTPAMLEAIRVGSLFDDVFEEDTTTIDLETHVAALAGKEAGLLVLSGTMGNQLALRSLLTQPPHSVLSDHRSHIIQYEAGGVSSLTGAFVQAVVPRNGIHLTLEDVVDSVCIDDDVHSCPTRVISLENTLNGMIMPLEEARRISAFAREHDIKMHLDGARLWEAAASGAGSLADYCSLFDTISLCFSKGLGAPIGSILVGPTKTIKHARWVRKSIGGGLRQSGVVAAPARIAVDQTFGTGPNGEGGLLTMSHDVAKKVEKLWTGLGGKLLHPVHTNMVWLDLTAAGCSAATFVQYGKDVGLKLGSGRIVVHYQIAQNQDLVLPKLEEVFQRTLAGNNTEAEAKQQTGRTSMYTAVTFFSFVSPFPPELNSILYWNEVTIAGYLNQTGNETQAAEWTELAANRSEAMYNLMWNDTLSGYFDYNLTSGAQDTFVPADDDTTEVEAAGAPEGQQVYFSVAQFYPFWTGAAPAHIKNNPLAVKTAFERVATYLDTKDGGIPATNLQTGEQWDQPSVWPPLMHILMEGLRNTPATFGESDPHYMEVQGLALRLGQRYLDSTFCTWYATGGSTSDTPQLEGFDEREVGIMFEKYSDNSTNQAGGGGEYEVVEGFGWTNGVLLWVVDTFGNNLTRPDCGDIEAANVQPSKRSAVELHRRDAAWTKKFGSRSAKGKAKRPSPSPSPCPPKRPANPPVPRPTADRSGPPECEDVMNALDECHARGFLYKSLGNCNTAKQHVSDCLKVARMKRLDANRAAGKAKRDEKARKIAEINKELGLD
ncbi:hypothetical protein BN1708_008528, partial [Verticillium longisporum]